MLKDEQSRDLGAQGLLLIEDLFNAAEAAVLPDACRRDAEIEGEHRVLEQDGAAARAIYASHLHRQSSTR